MNILDNLKRGLAIVQAAPEERFNLDWYGQKSSCGTLHCSAGWIAQYPHFQELGMRVLQKGEEFRFVGQHELDGIFGEHSYYRLFVPFASGNWDYDITGKILREDMERAITHKQLAIARFERAIKELE